MTLRTDIEAAVGKIFKEQWTTRDGTKVPDTVDLGLGNEAVKLDGTVLYADMAGSTKMVDDYKPSFAAEVYKTFLYSAARVIGSEGGQVVAYDGDRVMAVFIGGTKNTTAVRCALKINWVAKQLVMPALKKQYPKAMFQLRHVVGVDTSKLWVARTGVRGANDLVWVGKAANYAAKLTDLDIGLSTWITHRVYDAMLESARTASDGRNMWEKRSWTQMDGLTIYGSTFWWSL